MEHMLNAVSLRGELAALPVFSHENHGKRFFRFLLEVPRLSGTVDRLPVIAEQSLLDQMDLSAGSMLHVTGQIRSHNNYTETARRLLIFLFASTLEADEGEPINQVELSGILCKEPILRRTPLGREICDVMLAVPRTFHRADYLPCILWGRTAEEISACHTRDQIHIFGRMQSRIYTKITELGPQERTAYEISALEAEAILTEAEK